MRKKDDLTASRVEKHVIKRTDPYYEKLAGFCFLSKNLYNHANYLVRQTFTKEDIWLRYPELDRILKADMEYPDYRAMPTAQSAQQILRLLEKNWKSFFESVKDWKKNKEKYLGRPRLPKYLAKDGRYILILTNQNCRMKEGYLSFPKAFEGFRIKACFAEKKEFVSFQQVRLVPHRNRIVAELVYTVRVPAPGESKGRYAGIDIGVNNLAVVANNVGLPAVAVNGKPLKSMNQYYNRKASHYREISKRMNGLDYTARLDRLTEKRNAKMEDYLHKASRYIIDFCKEGQIDTIVIGQNKEWKQGSTMSGRQNQHFVQLPFTRMIEMIRYKAEEEGIAVITTEESYTSGTSFIDQEEPVKGNYNRNRRIHRGLFRADTEEEINADLNGAYQIIKKAFPIKWDRGCASHPVVVNMV